MSIVEQAIEIIKSRYESKEYKESIETIKIPAQRMYGVIDKPHAIAVLNWVKKLWPNTPDALMIAAIGHDWDRAFELERDKLEDYAFNDLKPSPEWYNVHKLMHSANTARILRRELQTIVPKKMLLDIIYLVLHHETGGLKDSNGSLCLLMDNVTNSYNLNEAANILQQADSLAFFNVLDIYVNWRDHKKIEQKTKFMYDRIKNPTIKEEIRNLNFKEQKSKDIMRQITQ